MKCIKKEDKVMRVPEHVAEERVKQGWSYCPKSAFKKSSDKEVIEKSKPVAKAKPKMVKKQKKDTENLDSIDAMINKKE